MRRMVPVLVMAVALGGCATQRPAGALLNEYLPYAGPPVDSFHFWHLYSWEAVGPYHVVLWADPWSAYFVTVWQPCINLDWAHRIAVTSTANTVSHFEAIVLPHGERCPIQEIRPIDVKAMNAAHAAEAAAKKGAAAAPPPAAPPPRSGPPTVPPTGSAAH